MFLKIRERILKTILQNPPEGDLTEFEPEDKYKISCIFVFYKRIHLLECILFCLSEQDFDRYDFEIIIVEDRGGTEDGKTIKDRFPSLNIRYFNPSNKWGVMGYMRNFGLSRARGEIVLFL
ncbi:MAG: glycosyltransferase family 2 protein, partial [Nitrospirae bacterium]|nr:glycosyltransferase family 2 protein [Nitrospirota bacterium]